MKRRIPSILVLLIALLASFLSASAQDFKKQVIHQLITDRFFAGTPSDNNPPQSPGLYDSTKTNWQLYWDGNFAGIQAKLTYLKGMGITAIWISPPLDNINVSIPNNGSPSAPYPGYSARVFQRTVEHFGDASSSWAAFDALTAAAHQTV
ncbi:MAG: alpha-amylase family glycosyl hydrolase [Acidobacteriaceae bacterium]